MTDEAEKLKTHAKRIAEFHADMAALIDRFEEDCGNSLVVGLQVKVGNHLEHPNDGWLGWDGEKLRAIVPEPPEPR